MALLQICLDLPVSMICLFANNINSPTKSPFISDVFQLFVCAF